MINSIISINDNSSISSNLGRLSLVCSVKSATFVPGASRMWRNLASWMYGRGVLCKRSINHFIHAPSSRSRKSTLFPTVGPAFWKRTYTVTKSYIRKIVSRHYKSWEYIYFSDLKCCKIKDSNLYLCLLFCRIKIWMLLTITNI